MFLLVDLLMAPHTLEALRTWAIALLAILASAVEFLCAVA
jgi:hypothetical protein